MSADTGKILPPPRTMQVTLRPLALAFLALLTGCSATGMSLSEAALEMNATLAVGETRLAAGDTIEITFPKKEEWDTTVLVRPDGLASFPYLDEVHVAGKTIAQLDERLTELYDSVFEVDPEVSLNVVAWGSREVIVVGMVNEPGPIQMSGPRMSLIEAIGQAGGHDRRVALMKQVLVVRWVPDEGVRHAWKIDARPDKWGDSKPVFLQSRDVVFVPNKPIDNVNIWIDQYIRQMIPIPQFIPGSL